ncbi:methyltransferase [Bacillus cereus group sp. Bc252]|uniref:methyltransferase n=1 Tax=Bacillus TaxID=1386 RepID=UPI00146DDF5C|nr:MULTISPECIES: methyltransferase [Bacillus cereus group]MCU5209206.1 methyltransferase [Bacillus paranthracis]MDA2164173.1 methyltransferase [Bacillus cereus group sp. Bc252]MDF9513349.1 methyltransferase [Bacillus paranthracis]MDF9672342.1 methyltransferase [Bacillus paranthracis]MDG1612063.1 methyltransferase [Bacillus paranthracis]
MRMKRYKVISATALAAMLLVTGSSTSVFAAEKETTTQQVVQASHVFSPQFIEQTKNLDAIPMNNLDKAVQAALLGPEIKKLKVFDHEFNVKPAYISKLGNQTVVNGQISHHLSFRLDDQVYYRFVKEDGVIKNLEIKIDRGGWTKITAPIGAIVAQYFGVPITPDLLSQIGQQLGALTDGKWEYASEAIVAAIGLYVE